MTNQDTSSHSVYLGYWINHSRGKILGATLTVTDSQGSLLIAFTALFISYVATRFWRIFCFVAHRHLSSPEPRDALHHQRQAILRNSSSAESSLWALLLLFTAWRGAENRVLRTIPLALFALVSVISFTIAGGLSSQISSSVGNEVLIRGENCGFLDSTHFTRDNKRIFDTYVSNSINNAGNWAQQCYYAEGRSGMLDCASFISKNLPAAFDENAPCPFQDSVCRTNSSNLRIDSGFLDSNDHLGLNAPADQRVQSRLVMHCAPLKTEGRDTTIWRRGGKYVLYDYGPVPPSWRENITTNFTMMAPDSQTQYNTSWGQIGAATYQLNTMIAYIENGTWNPKQASFRPYPDIFRSDADLILVFLVGNGVVFDKPLDDDWYRATAPARNLTLFALDNITNIPSYRPVDAASPMGCIQQYQFCNTALTNVPEKERCSPLASMADAVTAALPLFNSSVEEFNNFTATSPVASQFVWLTTLLMTMVNDASTVIRVQGAHALDSKRTLFAGSQGAALPRDQWKRDVGLWWSTQMAQIQSAVVQSAMGTVDEDMLQVWTKAEGVLSGGEVCANQVCFSPTLGEKEKKKI